MVIIISNSGELLKFNVKGAKSTICGICKNNAIQLVVYFRNNSQNIEEMP